MLYNPIHIHNAVLKVPFLKSLFKYFHGSKAPVSSKSKEPVEAESVPVDTDKQAPSKEPDRIFTKEELAKYKGQDGGDIYLAILGKVFDVTRGRDYYGPGGGYEFFSGVDGSRAFVSGNFKPDGLIEDISDLTNQDYIGLRDWVDFYAKDYKYIGKLDGKYYDSKGNPTKYYYQVQKWIKAASKYKEEEDAFKEKYPMCNIDYKPEQGTRVWCSTASGGVKRDWVGLPRSLYSAESNSVRCACVQESELNDPLLKVYEGCPEDSITCNIPK